MKSTVERVLIVHPFGIGDALFITPLIRAFHEHGAKKIDLVLGSRTKDLFAANPLIDEIFVVDRDELKRQSLVHNFKEITRLLWKLRANQYAALNRQLNFFHIHDWD